MDESNIIRIFELVLTSITTLVLAWLAYKQAELARNVKDVKTQTDGMKDQLIAEVRAGSLEKGNREGREEMRASAEDPTGTVAVVVKGNPVD